MKHISSSPDIMGGAPVIAGTRIPIEIILYRLKEGYTLSQIHDLYRHVPVDTFEKVIEELAEKLSSIIAHDKTFPQT